MSGASTFRRFGWVAGGVVAAVLVAAAGALDAGAAPAKPVVCKAGQVRVTLLGKARCRPFRAAPSTADQRVPLLRGVIGQRLPVLRTRSGRRIPPLSSVAGGQVGAAQARLVRSLPQILAWADSRVRTTAARTTAGPCVFGGPDNSTSLGGFDVSLSQSGDLSVSGNLPGGYRIEVFVGSGVSCSQLVLPDCPRADGALDGTDVHSNRIMMRISQNGVLVQSVSTNVRSNQTMKGKVAADAKLEAMALEDVTRETTTVRVPNDSLTFVLSVRRTAEINMRTGQPKGTPTVRAELVLRGATRDFRVRVGTEVERKYRESFPSLISEEVGNYRTRESAWQTPEKCATLTFIPTRDTIKVQKNVSGQVTANVESKQGGVAADGRWKVTAQANGTFTPQEASGGSTTFQYTPTASGPGVKLSGTFRATSTAGVAAGTWTQDAPPSIKRIAGTFGGKLTRPTVRGPSVIDFNGSVTFERTSSNILGGADGAYPLTNAGYTVSFSGIDLTTVTGCSMSGAGSGMILPGQVSGSIAVNGTLPTGEPPYTYTFRVSPPLTDMVTVTRHSCPPGAESFEGSTFQWPPGFEAMGAQTSADGITYAGSEDQTVMGAGQVINWSFQGTE